MQLMLPTVKILRSSITTHEQCCDAPKAARQVDLVFDIKCSSPFAAICKAVVCGHSLGSSVRTLPWKVSATSTSRQSLSLALNIN